MKSTDQNGRSITDVEARPPAEFRDSSLYINRELSWLSFNDRVLEEAQDASVPLLERLRFLAICASNLDEFFEVRVAGLQAQLYDNLEPQDTPPDGMGPLQQLTEISKRAHDFVARQYETWNTQVHPALVDAGIRLCSPTDLLASETAFLDDYFERLIFPALTPLAIDPAHPFPHLFNKTLNLILRLESESTAVESSRQLFAVLQVPPMLSRVVPLPETEGGGRRFILLRDVILPRLDSLFAGFRVSARSAFRVTRNSDLSIQENEVKSSLLSTVQETLRQRKWGAAVRLEITSTADDSLVSQLRSSLDLDERDVYRVDGPVDLTSLLPLCRVDGFRDLKEPIFEPQTPALLANRANMFALLRDQDLLVHHPYESFDSVIQFIEQAADDPQVLAIKQTLYRTADDNPIITALARAAESGKQVTTLVELQARLDEENNIVKARALQKAGVHVVYGVVGLKTHCKAILVVRREQDGIRRYVHLGTGNYNPTTARIYTDLSYFTSRPEFGEDASALFNHLTGYSHGHKWNRLVIAPYHLASRVVELIDRERKHAEAGHAARIIAKLNALVDPAAIEALYAASRAGVKIDLIVRGICCLRPGIPGISDRIRVTSIIDKFLEHSRIMYFQNNDNPEVYCSSADWMPRNFRRRVEIMFPIEDSRLQSRLVDGILGIGLADNVKARLLQPDGTYIRVKPKPGEPQIRSQVEYQKMSREFSPALILSESAEGAGEATSKPPTPERTPKREKLTSQPQPSRKH
jgi:polyphosphate kinase